MATYLVIPGLTPIEFSSSVSVEELATAYEKAQEGGWTCIRFGDSTSSVVVNPQALGAFEITVTKPLGATRFIQGVIASMQS